MRPFKFSLLFALLVFAFGCEKPSAQTTDVDEVKAYVDANAEAMAHQAQLEANRAGGGNDE